jgi:hypothetical protein
MYPVGGGLYALIVFLIPAFFGWLIGTVATLAILLARPRLPGVSWLVVGGAEFVWWRVIWAIQDDESMRMDHPVLSICVSFVIPLAIPTMAALGMRRLHGKRRHHLNSRTVPEEYPNNSSPLNSTSSAAEHGVAPDERSPAAPARR